MPSKKPLSSLLQSATGITRVFLENNLFLRKFLSGYLHKDVDVDDVLQQTYLNAFSKEKNGETIEKPKSFLFSVARNLALNELKRKSRSITDFIDECQADSQWQVTSTQPLEHEVEAHEALGIYCEAVALLPVKCRQVYLLRKVHGLSHKEIAQRMNISVNAVEKHLLRGMSKCRSHIEQRNQVMRKHPLKQVPSKNSQRVFSSKVGRHE